MRRTVLIYAVVGPVAGAALYLTISILARLLGSTSNLFAPLGAGAELEISMAMAARIGPALLLTWLPALLTGLATAWIVEIRGQRAWWASCAIGGALSGVGGYALIAIGRSMLPDAAFIPPAAGGAALIALVGFAGTLPCWLLAYRSSAQKR